MKRYLGLPLAVLCLALLCTPFHCNHVHTSECGKHGENCTHKCTIIAPRRDENPRA